MALSLVGIAVAWRPFAPGRLAIVPWVAPLWVIVTAVLLNHPAAKRRDSRTSSLRIKRTIAILSNKFSATRRSLPRRKPWPCKESRISSRPGIVPAGATSTGNSGREIHWLVIVKPTSNAAKRIKDNAKLGQVELVSEQDLAAYRGFTLLKFDENQNLTIHVPDKH